VATAASTYAAAARSFSALVDRLPQHGWSDPGLGVWDVRALAGHTSRALVTVVAYLARPATEEVVTSPEDYYLRAAEVVRADPTAVDQRGRDAGAALGTDPAATVRALVDGALAAVAQAADQDPVIETLVGGMRLSQYLPTRTFELAVHCQDLARAGGVQHELPEQVLGDALALAVRVAQVRGDGGTLLAALTGRSGLPPGFSVV
jgi:uncharacterized protein (TIGR03083 family)